TRLLESGSPGTMAASPLLSGLTAASRWSSRSPLARFASSEPWQAKQFFDRIGRTSRLKSTGLAVLASGLAAFGSPAGLGLAAGSAPTSRTHPSTISPVGLLAGCNIRLIDPTPFPRRGRRSLAGRVSLGAVPAGRPSPHGTGLYRIHSDAMGSGSSRVKLRESRRIVAISGEWRVASSEWRVASGGWQVASGGWRVASESEGRKLTIHAHINPRIRSARVSRPRRSADWRLPCVAAGRQLGEPRSPRTGGSGDHCPSQLVRGQFLIISSERRSGRD